MISRSNVEELAAAGRPHSRPSLPIWEEWGASEPHGTLPHRPYSCDGRQITGQACSVDLSLPSVKQRHFPMEGPCTGFLLPVPGPHKPGTSEMGSLTVRNRGVSRAVPLPRLFLLLVVAGNPGVVDPSLRSLPLSSRGALPARLCVPITIFS